MPDVENSTTKGATLRFSRIIRRAGLLLAAAVICGSLAAGGASAKSSRATAGLTIYAGSSMTTVLPQLDSGNKYSFGSSGTLATQITNGAPADVFMSANTTTPAALFAAGIVEKPVNFTRNTLAVVVPKSNPAGIKSIYDLTKAGTKIAEAAPSVPVGSYTVQVLNQMGINAAIQARVVSQETSDANVVAKVALGQVDAGFVYLSDYVIDPDHLTLIKVPAWAQPKITYSMAIVTKSPNQAAAQAVDGQGAQRRRSGDLRQERLPAAHRAGSVDHQARTDQGESRREGDAHRHELHAHDLGDHPGRGGEVQGRVTDDDHDHGPGEGEIGLDHGHESLRNRHLEAVHGRLMPSPGEGEDAAAPSPGVVAPYDLHR